MNRSLLATALVIGGLAASVSPAAENSASKAQQFLDQSGEQQKYAFILFYKDDNQATRAMAQTLKAGVAKRGERAAVYLVSVTDPAEQWVVKRFGVARTPLPFAVAVAPNGAVTGLYSQKLVDANLDGAFVTPGMAECMKSMQEKKLVLVCVHTSARGATPSAVKEFQADPEFRDRLAVISVQAGDSTEAQFLQQMEIVPAKTKGTTIVFLAPPAVLVGKFDATATKAEMAAALHKAGQCCDDPHCKHGQAKNSSTGRK